MMEFSKEFNKLEAISMLKCIMEEKDIHTAQHSKRVALYSFKIAEELSLSQEDQRIAYQVGILHDIGKLIVPEAILFKSEKLTKDEFFILQKHAADGAIIVEKNSFIKHYALFIRHHHEFFNGQGYPDQLFEEQIPLISRIISVADSFDAMTTNRIYKPQKSKLEAMEELKVCSGTQFDPAIVKKAIQIFEKIII